MEATQIFEFVLNPATAKPFLIGLASGLAGGFWFGHFASNKRIELLETDLSSKRERADELAKELKKMTEQHAEQKAERERQQAEKGAGPKDVSKGIRCPACGTYYGAFVGVEEDPSGSKDAWMAGKSAGRKLLYQCTKCLYEWHRREPRYL